MENLPNLCRKAWKATKLRIPAVSLVLGCLDTLDKDSSLSEILEYWQEELISLAEKLDQEYFKIHENKCDYRSHDAACLVAFRSARAASAIRYAVAHALDADPINALHALREAQAAIDETEVEHGS